MDNKKAIQVALIRHLLATSNTSIVVGVLLAAVLAYMQREVIASATVVVWFAIVALVALSRAILGIAYQRSAVDEERAIHAQLVKFRIGVLISGGLWGAAGFLLFPANDPDHQIFLIFMLAGLTAGGVVSYAADLICSVGYSLAVLVPLIIRLLAEGNSLSTAMSMACILYLVFMVMNLRQNNRNFVENVALRLEASAREETARASEDRYRLLLTHSPVGIMHYDTNLSISYCNDRFAEILRNSAERLIGLDMKALKEQAILPALRKVLEGELGYFEGHYMATYSDAKGWIAMTCAPSRNGAGEITGGVAIVQDITERKLNETALHESHLRISSLLDSMAEGAYGVDINGNCTFVNRAFLRILGYEHADEIIGKHIHELIHHSHPDGSHYPSAECKMYNAYRRNQEIHVADEVFWKKDGKAVPVEYWSQPVIAGGELRGALATFIDITKRRLAEDALRASEEKLRGFYELSPLGIALTDMNGHYIEFNQAFERICGYTRDELNKLDYWALTPKEYAAQEAEQLDALNKKGRYGPYEKEYIRKDGNRIPLLLNGMLVHGGDGQPYIWSIVEDITLRKLAEVKMHNFAFYDALTQLPNRRLLNDRLDQAISFSRRGGYSGALMFLDLDNFKPLNDQHGHEAGDLLLIEVARRICACIRETDTAARFGGDEFVVLLGELDKDAAVSARQADIVAEKIRAALSEPYLLTITGDDNAKSTVEHRCTSSIGVVVYNQTASREEVLKCADMAMYEAKNAGRNQVVLNMCGSGNAAVADREAAILRLNWDDSYACGETTIDQEHRRLFEIANQLIESAFTRDDDPQRFDAALDRLLAHVVQHFADEEAILKRNNYADLESHALAHQMLIKHALQLRDEAAAGGVTMGELVNFLANEVVAQHMLKADRKFFPLFRNPPTVG